MAERGITVEVDEEMWAVTSHLKVTINLNGQWMKDITMPREATPLDISDRLLLEGAKHYINGKTEIGEIFFDACRNVGGNV